jgi:alkylated DNA nucleotide flippase Atl1
MEVEGSMAGESRRPESGSGYDPEWHGPRRVVGPGFREQVYAVVCRVPAGSVTTFGDVAGQLGLRSVARQVGFALAALPADRTDVPWHRVVTARGAPSVRGSGSPEPEQIARLAADGVMLDASGRVEQFAARRHRYRARRT